MTGELSELTADLNSIKHIVATNSKENGILLRENISTIKQGMDKISMFLDSYGHKDFQVNALSENTIKDNWQKGSRPTRGLTKELFSIHFLLNNVNKNLKLISEALIEVEAEEIEFIIEHFSPGKNFEANQKYIGNDLDREKVEKGTGIVQSLIHNVNKVKMVLVDLKRESDNLNQLIEDYNKQIVQFSNINNLQLKNKVTINPELVNNLIENIPALENSIKWLDQAIHFDKTTNVYLKKLHAEIKHEGYKVSDTILGEIFKKFQSNTASRIFIKKHNLDQNIYFLIYLDLMLKTYKLMELNYKKLHLAKDNNIAFENQFNEAVEMMDKTFLQKLEPTSIYVIGMPFRTDTAGSSYINLIMMLKKYIKKISDKPNYNAIFKTSNMSEIIASLIILNFHKLLSPNGTRHDEELLRLNKFIRDMEIKLRIEHNENIAINENKLKIGIMKLNKSLKEIHRPYFVLLGEYQRVSEILSESMKYHTDHLN